MFYKTNSLYKDQYRNGIIIWSAKDIEHLKELINQKIDLLLEGEIEYYLDFVNRHGDKIEIVIEEPTKENTFLSIEQILLTVEELVDNNSGIIIQYIEY